MKEFPSLPANSPEAEEKFAYVERIFDSESLEFKQFYEFLEASFEPGELEPIDRYKEELGRKDPDIRFFCLAARNRQGDIISTAYGSYIESEEILAIRFLATKESWRGKSVSQLMDEKLFNAVHGFGDASSMVGEAVDKSESYWNRVGFSEKGNSMRRLYYSSDDSHTDFSKEVFYRLPPFEWDKDGTPISDPHQSEHLQAAVKGYKDKIPVSELEKILRAWWQKWYIKSRENFESDQAFERHQNYVTDILENEIIKPLKDTGLDYVIPVSKAERIKVEGK
jgi:hypothetical protein